MYAIRILLETFKRISTILARVLISVPPKQSTATKPKTLSAK